MLNAIKVGWFFDGKEWFDHPEPLRLQGSIFPANIVDFSNYTIIPGLVDAHVHLALPQALEKNIQPEEILAGAKQNAAQIAAQGIAAVRDGGDLQEIGLQLSRQNQSELLIQSGGAALRRPHLYGTFLGTGTDSNNWTEIMQAYKQKGAKHLKILVSGIMSFKKYGRVGDLQFSQQKLNELVKAAQAAGLPVMAHASSDPAVKMAVEAGVQSIEHGYLVEKSTLQQMAEKQITWVPTLAAVANHLEKPHVYHFSPEQRQVIARLVAGQLESLGWAAEMGVPLAVGTDSGSSGVSHGQDYLTELQLYQKAGLSPTQILTAATSGGASLIPDYAFDRWLAIPGNLQQNLALLKKQN